MSTDSRPSGDWLRLTRDHETVNPGLRVYLSSCGASRHRTVGSENTKALPFRDNAERNSPPSSAGTEDPDHRAALSISP